MRLTEDDLKLAMQHVEDGERLVARQEMLIIPLRQRWSPRIIDDGLWSSGEL